MSTSLEQMAFGWFDFQPNTSKTGKHLSKYLQMPINSTAEQWYHQDVLNMQTTDSIKHWNVAGALQRPNGITTPLKACIIIIMNCAHTLSLVRSACQIFVTSWLRSGHLVPRLWRPRSCLRSYPRGSKIWWPDLSQDGINIWHADLTYVHSSL